MATQPKTGKMGSGVSGEPDPFECIRESEDTWTARVAEKSFRKYSTEINEGNLFLSPRFARFSRHAFWIYEKIFDGVISSWLKL